MCESLEHLRIRTWKPVFRLHPTNKTFLYRIDTITHFTICRCSQPVQTWKGFRFFRMAGHFKFKVYYAQNLHIPTGKHALFSHPKTIHFSWRMAVLRRIYSQCNARLDVFTVLQCIAPFRSSICVFVILATHFVDFFKLHLLSISHYAYWAARCPRYYLRQKGTPEQSVANRG